MPKARVALESAAPPFADSESRPPEVAIVITRTAKMLLLAAIALYYTLVVFNNLTDFDSNYQFVHHVLAMDGTIPGNHGMWRALPSPAIQLAFYLASISWSITQKGGVM